MCGIAGWNLKDAPNAHFVAAMAYGILDRGYESWGYFDGQEIKKNIGPIVEGIRAHEMLSPAAFIHTRQSTTGKVTKRNAHPFDINGIIGAHNGVIYNHFDVQRDHNRSLSVDSMHIFQHMSEGKPLSDLEGYGAIEFWKDGKWYIGACNAGSLVVAKLRNDAGVIWASTEDCLRAAAFQGEYEIATYYKVEDEHVYRVETDCLYESDMKFDLTKKSYAPISSTTSTTDSKDKQEKWWENMSDFEYPDIPPLFFEVGKDGTETQKGECEFCNEEDELTEIYGSYVCNDCLHILREDARQQYRGHN